MQKKTIATLFLLIFLVSCASPALQITATSIAQPTRTTAVTQTPSPTETTTTTPTDSAPATPAEARALVEQGMLWDADKQMAYDEKTGLVEGMFGLDGAWVEFPGGSWIHEFPDGYVINVPVFANVQDALNYISANGLKWGMTQINPLGINTVADNAYADHWSTLSRDGDASTYSSGYFKAKQTSTGDIARLYVGDIERTVVPFHGVKLLWDSEITGDNGRVFVPNVSVNEVKDSTVFVEN